MNYNILIYDYTLVRGDEPREHCTQCDVHLSVNAVVPGSPDR